MCLVEGSLEYSTSTCKMCTVMKEVYNVRKGVCPHKSKMQVCRRRENHPRADIVYHTNAEIRTFNGCGYCKARVVLVQHWADAHAELAKRGLLQNTGWPGCCRAPSQHEYTQYIKPEDWTAVSHLYKLSRSSAPSDNPKNAAAAGKEDPPSTPKQRTTLRAKQSSTAGGPSTSSASSASTPTPGSRSTRVVPADSSLTSSIIRSTTPPLVSSSSSSNVHQRGGAKRSGAADLKTSPSPSDESPDTPPTRPYRELSAAAAGGVVPNAKKHDPNNVHRYATATRDVTVVRYAPPSEFDVPITTTMVPAASSRSSRQTVAIQTQNGFYSLPPSASSSKTRLSHSSPSGSSNGSGSSPNASLVPLDSSSATTAARSSTAAAAQQHPSSSITPPAIERGLPPMVQIVPLPTRNLPESRLPPAAPPAPAAMGGARYSTPAFVIAPNAELYPNSNFIHSSSKSSSSSSSSSDSGDGSETSVGSSHSDGASTARGGSSSASSSDFTDFMSDDSEEDVQREAEERAAEAQRQRVERAEDREFRDAQRRLEAFDLTESMGISVRPAPTGASFGAGGGGTIGRRGGALQSVTVGRYR
ncbi:hypothetical protein DL93DRAFT_2098402 [Clavulina sp. PMI_390]|nr:hypothetical protein DL93DRAFT_2098402 [Clavulina sp. PMI_390]